ncbi:uncharacterized protein J3D65DRAFT_614255 [Phyllosticta citribraziliensis]|uniref:Secreted protein n=1 Tax=Phyllosticta citribraziliensis TaxID=989973 RepID=A0ABR1M6J1_9PEZI
MAARPSVGSALLPVRPGPCSYIHALVLLCCVSLVCPVRSPHGYGQGDARCAASSLLVSHQHRSMRNSSTVLGCTTSRSIYGATHEARCTTICSAPITFHRSSSSFTSRPQHPLATKGRLEAIDSARWVDRLSRNALGQFEQMTRDLYPCTTIITTTT